MQQVRLWEITPDRKLSEVQARSSVLEQWLEDWLVSDISALDPGLMVIGRQVRTGFGGVIDLLCIEMNGDLVVVELKSGRTGLPGRSPPRRWTIPLGSRTWSSTR